MNSNHLYQLNECDVINLGSMKVVLINIVHFNSGEIFYLRHF